MIPTAEEVEALALMAEKSAYIAGVHDLPKLQQDWTAVYTTLRALDAERRELRDLITERAMVTEAVSPDGEPREVLRRVENYYRSLGKLDAEEDKFRAQLVSARNAALEKAARICDAYADEQNKTVRARAVSKAIRAIMTQEAK